MNLKNLKAKIYFGVLSFIFIYSAHRRGIPKGQYFEGNLKLAEIKAHFCQFLHYLWSNFRNFCTQIITKLFSIILIQWSQCRGCTLSFYENIFYFRFCWNWAKMISCILDELSKKSRSKIPKDCREISKVPQKFGWEFTPFHSWYLQRESDRGASGMQMQKHHNTKPRTTIYMPIMTN